MVIFPFSKAVVKMCTFCKSPTRWRVLWENKASSYNWFLCRGSWRYSGDFFFPWVICWKDYSCTCCCCLCYTWLCLRYWWRSPPVWAVDVLPLGCPQDELPIVGQPELPSACLLAAFNGWNYTLVVQGCSRYFISIQCYLYAPREILSMEAQKEIRGKQWVGKRLEITIFIFI